MILKSLLDSLISSDRARLMIAFESHLSQYIELPFNHYIGVNIQNSNFIKEEEAGAWSYGRIVEAH